MFLEFDIDRAPEMFNLIRFFWKELKPSIKAKIEEKSRKLDNWEKLVKNIIEVKAKARFRPTFDIWETDHCYLQGNCLAYTTVTSIQTQDFSMQDSITKNPKSKFQKSKLSSLLHLFKSENVGILKMVRKKKDCWNH